MKVLNRRRVALLCAGLGSVGAVSAFTFGATSAQFTSAAEGQTNTITDGTVVLHGSQGGSLPPLNIPVLNPGDAYCNAGYFPGGTKCPGGTAEGAQTPTGDGTLYHIAYTGTSNAFVALDMKVSSTAAAACTTANKATSTLAPSTTGILPSAVTAACSGANAVGTLPVFDGDAANIDLVSGSSDPSSGQIPLLTDTDFDNAATCSTDASSVVTCVSEIKNVELTSFADGTPAPGNVNPLNDEEWPGGHLGHVDIALSVALPQNVTNAVQGSGAVVTLSAHAVQVANNIGSVTSGSPKTGVCDATTFIKSVVVNGSGDSYCPLSWR